VPDRRQPAENGRIADQNVETAEPLVYRAAHLVDLRVVGEVHGRQDGGGRAVRPDLIVDFLQRSLRAGDQNDLRPLFRVAPGDRRADAARRAGDEGDAALQPLAVGHSINFPP